MQYTMFFYDQSRIKIVDSDATDKVSEPNQLDSFIQDDQHEIYLMSGETIPWFVISGQIQNVFVHSEDEKLDQLINQCVWYMFDLVHQNPRLIPNTNRDFLGLCVSKLFTCRGMGRNQLKIAIRKVISSMVNLKKDRCLEGLVHPDQYDNISLDNSFQPTKFDQWLQYYDLFQPVHDALEALHAITKVEQLLSGHCYLQSLFLQHYVGQRTIAEMANLFEMTELDIQRYLGQAQSKTKEMKLQYIRQPTFIGMGI